MSDVAVGAKPAATAPPAKVGLTDRAKAERRLGWLLCAVGMAAGALHVLYGYDTHYKLDQLPELGDLVRRLSDLPIAVNKPILGSRNFTRESGIGVDLVVKQPLAMFGTHPALTGRSGDVVLGKKSGKASITYTLEQMGISGTSDEAVNEMLQMVKERSIEKRGLITPEEFRDIADRVLASATRA